MKIVCKHRDKTWIAKVGIKKYNDKTYYWTMIPTKVEKIGWSIEDSAIEEGINFIKTELPDWISERIAKNTVWKKWEIKIQDVENDCAKKNSPKIIDVPKWEADKSQIATIEEILRKLDERDNNKDKR